jgi:hypothetical protein
MDQLSDLELLPKEGRIQLALKATKEPQNLSVRRAAIVYQVSRRSINRRRAGTQSTRDTHPKSSALTKAEEQTLVQYIRKLNAQGLAPTLH